MAQWIVSGNSFSQNLTQPKSFFVEDFTAQMLRSLNSCVNDSISLGQGILPITISSRGGCGFMLSGAISILEKAKKNGVKIATIVSGVAQSAGALLFCMGSPSLRFVPPLCSLMIHNPSLQEADGKLAEIKSLVGVLEKMNKPLLETVSKNLGKRANWLEKKLITKGGIDWYLDAEEALNEGIATHIHNPTFILEQSSHFLVN